MDFAEGVKTENRYGNGSALQNFRGEITKR